LITFQNGLDNVDIIERIVSQDVKVIGGITSHGATRASPGIINHGGIGDTKIGWPDGHLDEDILNIASSFTTSGIETIISTNIKRDIWAKALVNSVINPLTALQGEENGCILREAELPKLARAIIEEGVRVANGAGHSFDIEEVFDLTMKIATDTSNNRSSMLQDIDNNRRTEIDQINGEIARIGSGSGIATPIDDALIAAVKERGSGIFDKDILNKIALLVS
ncbi:MAG: 2-dehydropantoate 2-reductase, partial [Thermoplasmata archaeon]|nr:2-dehydropantoate 2-reductase [Thermoplasmata archaeon]